MSFVQRVKSFGLGINQTASDLVGEINAHFGSTEVVIQDVTISRPESPYSAGAITVRVLYAEALPGYRIEARLFEDDPGVQTAQDSFNQQYAYFASCDRPAAFLDVSENQVRRTWKTRLLVLFALDPIDPAAGFIGQAQGIIAAGASGLVDLLDATGEVVGTETVFNVGLAAIAAGERFVVLYDYVDGALVALPSNCQTVGLTTTTSSTTTYNPPCMRKEVVSVYPYFNVNSFTTAQVAP